MYGNGVAGDRERVIARILELRKDPARLCERARAGVEVLASHPRVDGRLAAVGYCFGGMTVLELARSGMNLAGVISLHGSLETSRPAQPGSVRAKILVCHGALDPHVPMAQVTVFVEEMKLSRGRLAADYLRGRDAWFHTRRRSLRPGCRVSRRFRCALHRCDAALLHRTIRPRCGPESKRVRLIRNDARSLSRAAGLIDQGRGFFRASAIPVSASGAMISYPALFGCTPSGLNSALRPPWPLTMLE